MIQAIKNFLKTKNIDLSIQTALLETMRHLYIDLIVFSKSSMKEGSSDIRLFGFKTK